MESSSPPDGTDTKVAFRKPSNDAANRKYRRRSPAKGSSSPEGGPNLDHISSPINSGEPTKASEHRSRKKDSERELEGDAPRGQYDRDGDRHTDRQFCKSSHGYSRHNDYVRHDKRVNDGERNGERYSERISSRSGRESRTSDFARREIDHGRSKEHLSSGDKSNRDRYDISGHRSRDMEKVSSYQENPSSERAGSGRRHKSSNLEQMDRDWHKRGRDEKRDYHQSSRDSKNDRFLTYEESESRIGRNKSSREGGGHRMREADKRELKEHDKEEKKKYNDWEPDRDRDQYKVKADFASENQDKPFKKSKFSNWDKGGDYAKDSEKSSSSKQAPEAGGNVAQAHANANDSEVANDLDAAKVAAMRAAELVNKNLVGVGYMSADQKKKLLWGNKKSTVTEESGNRWDTALIGDRDRQEKFQKLMSLRLPWYIWPIVGCEGRAEGGTETQQSRSGREATGTPARFGEAVHSWTSTERWSHCRIGSLNINCGSLFCEFLYYSSCAGIWVLFLYFCYVRKHVFFCWGYQILEKEKCHSDMVVFQYLSGFAGLFLFK